MDRKTKNSMEPLRKIKSPITFINSQQKLWDLGEIVYTSKFGLARVMEFGTLYIELRDFENTYHVIDYRFLKKDKLGNLLYG